MLDTRFLRASDGTGPAPIARINTARIAGATVYKVDTVNKWPPQAFIATVGTLNVNGYLDPTLAPINQFRGHITGSDIIIDSWEPGSAFGTVDLGNAVNQYIILKQTTGTANLTQDALAELQTEDQVRAADTMADFIKPGTGIWSVVSGLNCAMTAVTAYQAGLRATLAAVTSRAFTPNKDTYVDLLRGGTALVPTFTLVYTEVVNNASSPVLAANSIRLAIVVSGAATITYINQGGIYATAPVVASCTLTVNDSAGNLICPNTPNPKLIGYRTGVNTSAGAGGNALITGTTCPVNILPAWAGRRIKAMLIVRDQYNNTAGQYALTTPQRDLPTTASIGASAFDNGGSTTFPATSGGYDSPGATGVITYGGHISAPGGGTATAEAGIVLMIELD